MGLDLVLSCGHNLNNIQNVHGAGDGDGTKADIKPAGRAHRRLPLFTHFIKNWMHALGVVCDQVLIQKQGVGS